MCKESQCTRDPFTFLCVEFLEEIVLCANDDGLQGERLDSCTILVLFESRNLRVQEAIQFLLVLAERLSQELLALLTHCTRPVGYTLNQSLGVREIDNYQKYRLAKSCCITTR